MTDEEYIARVASMDIGATEALADLEDTFETAFGCLARIKGVYDALTMGPASAYAQSALDDLKLSAAFRTDSEPF